MAALKTAEELFARRAPAPRRRGVVYFLFRCGVVVYVGQTTRLGVRLASHEDAGLRFDSYSVLDAGGLTTKEREHLEHLYIVQFQPQYNRSGRKAKSGVLGDFWAEKADKICQLAHEKVSPRKLLAAE